MKPQDRKSLTPDEWAIVLRRVTNATCGQGSFVIPSDHVAEIADVIETLLLDGRRVRSEAIDAQIDAAEARSELEEARETIDKLEALAGRQGVTMARLGLLAYREGEGSVDLWTEFHELPSTMKIDILSDWIATIDEQLEAERVDAAEQWEAARAARRKREREARDDVRGGAPPSPINPNPRRKREGGQ